MASHHALVVPSDRICLGTRVTWTHKGRHNTITFCGEVVGYAVTAHHHPQYVVRADNGELYRPLRGVLNKQNPQAQREPIGRIWTRVPSDKVKVSA